MRNRNFIIIGIASLAFIGLTVLFTKKTIKTVRLTKIADAGYETAADILYPEKNIPPRGRRA